MTTVTVSGPAGPFTNTVPLAARASGFVLLIEFTPVLIPTAIPSGIYTGSVKVQVDFSADFSNPPQSYIARFCSQLCLVDPVPGNPALARIELITLTNPLIQCPPGGQLVMEFQVRINDPINSVTLNVAVDTEQNARMPSDPGNPGTASNDSITRPVSGDDFPIAFLEDLPIGGLIPLSVNPDTYVQPPITKSITIPPLGTENVPVVLRSYHGCANGSCSQNVISVQGNFANGDPALACASGSLIVRDTALDHLPYSEFCFGDGGNQLGCTGCPCGNNARLHSLTGCLNSIGTGARLEPWPSFGARWMIRTTTFTPASANYAGR